MTQNRQIVIDQLPQGKLTPEHFRLTEGEIPAVGEGQVLLRTRYMGLDAANRAWMMGRTYRSALEAGQVMAGGGLAEVVESRDPGFKPGDLVSGDIGWQDYSALPGRHLSKVGPAEPMSHLLSVYGVAGLTAYFGLLKVGHPKPGETVVVSAAAGGVGSIVGQIARIKGCRAVGVAGGEAKCAALVRDLGFDAAVDYKAGPVWQALREAAPDGIDVYFDNTGGEILEACLFNMANHGRIACCGAVSQYDTASPVGPRGIPGLLVTKMVTMRGFLVMEWNDEREAALAELKGWVESGRLKPQEDIIDGLENLPRALVGLLAGENIGKRIVRVS